MQKKARAFPRETGGTRASRAGLTDMAKVRLMLAPGTSLLEGLLENGIAVGHDCGGLLACASCQVVVLEGTERLAPPGEDELDMLERSCASPGARLACQANGAGGELVVDVDTRLAAADAPSSSPIRVTERAAAHFRSQLARRSGAIAVRLSVEPSGCSGFGYRVDPAPAIHPGDAVFESYGVRILVDRASLPYVHGSTLDVVQEGLARRLRFDNPNARQACGCGESFST
jgi:iron-sulfur cluster assembly accessory protein